ncbi:RNA polymerase-associated protein RapA [Jeotgalibaca dankookensis]|uniref:RNA polymerase-associated protein RapA n=1 Tax=Jeotgalibaca dankookensis TaxID=708126 RepID=A0A1S6ILU0_9LACT|nr:DEAD/DEAH box helicase [Jeotgalibaca dankookensis]AQS52515.1 RNA polymerase-associated protein RapA [Jeotgalibaca dankookensis]
MEFKPHGYQQQMIEYIDTHPVAALFLDMGLGKTVITLTAIKNLMYDSFEVKKVLVIAPLRVARDTWPNEIEKWNHLQDLRYSAVVGNQIERQSALKQEVEIYIINRENVTWLIEKSGYQFDFDMVIIDELSSFKSHAAKRFKSLLKVRPFIKRIVGLTGTPSSNGLMDLWAQFRILDKGERLGRFITHYRQRYFDPDQRNGMVIYSYKPKPEAEEAIYNQIEDITVSMKAEDYLDLPDFITNEVVVRLSDKERKVYDEMRKEMIVEVKDKEIDAINAASLSNKLLQMASGSVYDEQKESVWLHDRKLDALEDLVEAANGKPLLVVYWFKHDLTRITQRFDVKVLKTQQDFQDWNKGLIPIALIHPASAGHGLNLQAGGSTLVWFSLTWSLELYQQTNARLYRQGQKESVVVHHIITEDTIDEDVMKALRLKDKFQNQLMEAVKAELEVS